MVEKQARFTFMIAILIIYAFFKGYKLTFGDAYRYPEIPYGNPRSLHKRRLAVDFNVFKNGVYLKEGSQFADLGLFWEFLGGSWGGRFDDENHFSLEHNGVK